MFARLCDAPVVPPLQQLMISQNAGLPTRTSSYIVLLLAVIVDTNSTFFDPANLWPLFTDSYADLGPVGR